jgi:hypothetical protein
MSTEARKPTDVLRERRGPVPEELRDQLKHHNAVRKAITDALAGGPRSAPEIAADTGIASHELFWHLTAMRKYGTVTETEQAGDYYRYALTKKDDQ